MMTPDEIAQMHAPGAKPSGLPRPLAPRFYAAYALGYAMYGLRRPRSRQFQRPYMALWHSRELMRYWNEGHADKADRYPMRYRLRTPTQTRRAPTQLALLPLEEPRDGQ